MNFTTPIPISKYSNPIDYNSKIVLLGSCFSENIAEKFDYFQFQNTSNPFGIIFNPISIENLINKAINQDFFTENDLFFHNQKWQSFDVHSELSHTNKTDLLNQLNQLLTDFYTQIQAATHIIITYGTSWVYQHKLSNKIVANCHKVPQNQFNKILLSTEIIEKSIKNTQQIIQKFDSNCTFIFTVSPVRHIKDGFIENQVSKAHLLSSIYKSIQYEICNRTTELSQLNTTYFPSYEILMDELRDYRFYAPDMIHPSPIAIDYIWQQFAKNYISPHAQTTMQSICNIQKSIAHKPFDATTASHQHFLSKLENKINNLRF
jgi:GSCFA family